MDKSSQPMTPFHREVARVLRSALTFPGRVFPLPLGNVSTITSFATIGDTLLSDKQTYFTIHPDLSIYLSRTGAKPVGAAHAAYHFYPDVDDKVLQSITQAASGMSTTPDNRAAIFVACKLRTHVTLRMSGPGIPDVAELEVNQLPTTFWETRQRTHLAPHGWDLYLVDGRQVVGLPRSTVVEVHS